MSTAVIETSINSLSELVESAIDYLPPNEHFWFRGVSDSNYSLVPKAYRNLPSPDGSDFLTGLEQRLLDKFRQRAAPYLPATQFEMSNAALLVHMQHYGAPTRLLDWTENLLIAAYFSVSNENQDNTKIPAIWALRPSTWNETVSSDFVGEPILTFDSSAFPPNQSPLLGWLPLEKENRSTFGKRDLALAVYATHSNDRIRAQQGVFTVAGTSTEGLETQIKARNPTEKILYKFSFIGGAEKLRHELNQIGYKRSLVYPSLESICIELEEEHRRI